MKTLGSSPSSHPCTIQLLSKAALFYKLLLQLPQQFIKQEIGLVDQADQSIGDGFGFRIFNIGPLRPIKNRSGAVNQD